MPLRWRRHFFALAALNVASNLMVPLASLIDGAFLAHLDDLEQLGGVALAAVIFDYVYWSFGFLRMGTTGLVAQASGRGDTLDAARIGVRGLMVAGVAGLVILALSGPLADLGFALLGGEPAVEEAGRGYFAARVLGAPAALGGYVLLGWLLGQGHGRAVLLLSVIGNGTNVLLDYWFVVRLDMGAVGAGQATAAADVATLAVGLALTARQLAPGLRDRAALLDPAALRTLVALNRDILVRTLALVTAFAVFTNLSAGMGTGVLAANALILRVQSTAAWFIDGVAFATESVAGSLFGRGDRDGLSRLLKTAGWTGLAAGLAFGVPCVLAPEAVFGVLSDHPDLIRRAGELAPWLLPVLAFGAPAFVLDGYFIGITSGPVLRTAMLWAVAIGFVPLAVLAWWQQSPHLLWLAMTAFMAARTVTLGVKVPATLP